MTHFVPSPVGSLNCHMGGVIRQGGLNWALDHHRAVPLWSLQEVMSKSMLQRHLRGTGFNAVHADRREPGTINMLDSALLYHRERFTLEEWWAPYNGHGELDQHGNPRARYRVVARLKDKKTGRIWCVGAVHNEPMAKAFAEVAEPVRARHGAQTQEFIDWAHTEGLADKEAVVVLAGDWNEHLGARVPPALEHETAEGRLRAAGMVFAHTEVSGGEVTLDDVAHLQSPFMHTAHRQTFETPAKSEDHAGVVVTYRVAPI